MLWPTWQPRMGILLGELTTAPATLMHYGRLIEYWVGHLGYLRHNPETGVADFEWIETGGDSLDDFDRAKLEWHRGRFKQAIAGIENYQAAEGESKETLFWLAMAYMRQAEQLNCLDELCSLERKDPGAPPGMCALPLTRYHVYPEIARHAAGLFEHYLDEYDADDMLVRWLLNFSWMTVDGFPDQVPEPYLIQTPFIDLFYGERAAEIRRTHQDIRLTDKAAAFGADVLDAGKGVAVEDFDNDGFLDIVTGGFYTDLKYLRNKLGKGFEDVAADRGLAGIRGSHIITAADFNGDGWMDLFVSQPVYGNPLGSYTLMQNDGSGGFTNVTRAMGLDLFRQEGRQVIAWTSAWADIDLDGDLDLYLALLGDNVFDQRPPTTSRLFRNDGESFTDVTDSFGISEAAGDAYNIGAAFGDYDADGDPDLFLTNVARGRSVLLRNEEGRRFVRTDLIIPEEPGFMTAFLDVDHDFDLDLFVGGSGPARSVTEMAVFGQGEESYKLGRSVIWLQDEKGRFARRPDLFREGLPITTMGANFGDLNNDGAIDYYLGTGGPEGWMLLPNLMFLGEMEGGRPTGHAQNISMLEGLGSIQKGHGIVFFDFDNDGDQDVYSSLGGMWPGDEWVNQLFVNDSKNVGNWIKIRLQGVEANRHGLGARIRVRAQDAEGRPLVRTYHMDNGTGFGSTPYLAHIGLDRAVRITDIEVAWPGHGPASHHTAGINTQVTLRQPDQPVSGP